MSEPRENVIEWVTGQQHVSCTLTQQKFINKIRKLRDESVENVPVFIENHDGSIFCHLPIEMLKIGKKRKIEISEERRAELAEHMRSMHKSEEDRGG